MDREFLAPTTTKSSMRWESVLMSSSNKQCTSRICNWTYIVYINDLPAKLQSKVQLFADDTIVYMAVANETDAAIVQKDLKLLEEWENRSQMSFHLDKCYVPWVTRCRNPHDYILHNQILKCNLYNV